MVAAQKRPVRRELLRPALASETGTGLFRERHSKETALCVNDTAKQRVLGLIKDGAEELTDMIRAARITTKTGHEFLEDFVDDADLISRIGAQSLR